MGMPGLSMTLTGFGGQAATQCNLYPDVVDALNSYAVGSVPMEFGWDENENGCNDEFDSSEAPFASAGCAWGGQTWLCDAWDNDNHGLFSECEETAPGDTPQIDCCEFCDCPQATLISRGGSPCVEGGQYGSICLYVVTGGVSPRSESYEGRDIAWTFSGGYLTVYAVDIGWGVSYYYCAPTWNGWSSFSPFVGATQVVEFASPKVYGPFAHSAGACMALRQSCVGGYTVGTLWQANVVVS